jgi:hypothetical protein
VDHSEPNLRCFHIEKRSYRLGVLGILLLAAALRLWAIDFGLPHLRTRPDELPVVERTGKLANGHLDIDWAVYPHSYIYATWAWGEAGYGVARMLGAAQADDYRGALRHDRATLLLVIRLFSALIGVATVWASMHLARSLFGRAPALALGFLVATSFLSVRESHAVKPDIFLSLAVMVTMICIRPLALRATPRAGLWAGLAAGSAMAAKFPGLLLAPSVYFAAMLGSSGQARRRLLPLPALTAALSAALLFMAVNPFLVFSPRAIAAWEGYLRADLPQLFGESEASELAQEVHGENQAQAQARFERMSRVPNFVEFGAHPWWYGFVHHTRVSLRYGAGLIPTLLAPLAILWAIAPGSRRLRAWTWPAALFVVIYFGVFGLSPVLVSRYMTPLVPVLLLLEVGMIASFVARVARRGGMEPGAALVLLALSSVVIGAESMASTLAHNRIAARTDTRVLATRWLAEHAPRESRVKDVGTIFMPYGRPQVPKGLRPSTATPDVESLSQDSVDYIVSHDHALASSSVEPDVLAALEPHLRLLAEIDPSEGARANPEAAVWEYADFYYIPIHGFASVYRPGPLVRIYAFEP